MATDGALTLILVTYERKVLEVACDEVSLPGSRGYFGVLPGHVPLVSALTTGVLTYRAGRSEHAVALSSGFAEIADDVVSVLAEAAELPAEIDVAATEKERSAAQADLDAAEGREFVDAMARLDRATSRLEVARRGR